MTTTHTDLKTYPGDRNTRRTPDARRRAMRGAQTSARLHLERIDALLADLSANSYRLNPAEEQQQRELVELAYHLDRIARMEAQR